jgi:glycosyltransferase involved in cell wall biosynthesis
MISILMPIYNGIEFIDESVSSILNQTYENWELLIGINGHPENSDVFKTAKKYESDSRIKVYDFYTIKSKSQTLNKLTKFCNYNYIALLDVDDIWLPHKLFIQSTLLGEYDVIGSNCVYFGDMEGIVPKIPVGNISNFNFFEFNPIINSSAVIRKDLCYWEYEGIEDYDLWLRLRKLNKKFFNYKDILIKHRIHINSAFNSKGQDVNSLKVSHIQNW